MRVMVPPPLYSTKGLLIGGFGWPSRPVLGAGQSAARRPICAKSPCARTSDDRKTIARFV